MAHADLRRIGIFVLVSSALAFAPSKCIALEPSARSLRIGSSSDTNVHPEGIPPYFYAILDAAGYSDWIWYGVSPIHQYDYHEVLSGEWGAAIYYDGIATAPQAKWLTSMFLYPDWETHNDFLIPIPSDPNAPTDPYSWNNPSNPTPENDTGWSVIENAQVRIEIDYEVVDLGPRTWSPLACNGTPSGLPYAKSDRYVMLQTYTITNIDPTQTTLTNIEFYQMLHSHGANDYGSSLTSIYNDAIYDDPLEDYVPYNSVHTIGNFQYDITQWNDPDHPEADILTGTLPHCDWVGFSSAQEPDVIENGYYTGNGDSNGNGKPYRPGTHWNIEDRNLNGQMSSQGEVAGAMGWFLGSLAYNESTSITVAFMVGHDDPPRPGVVLEKTDNIDDCIDPSSPDPNDYTITYTIEYANPITDPNDPEYVGTLYDVILKDLLPPDIDPFDVFPSDNGVYDWTSHTVTWDLGDLEPGDSGSVTVAVIIAAAEPSSIITNTAILEDDYGWITATETTPVCCYGPDIIYVRAGHNGLTGTSWQDAYPTLQQALARAARNCGNEIWVATGAYTPPGDENDAFNIFDGLRLYGGFEGYETSREQRNFVENPTILDGQGHHRAVLEPNQAGYATTVIDGFIVTGATQAGISILNCSNNLHLTNCLSHYNTQGLYSHYSDPNITACVFAHNTAEGVACYEGDRNPTLDRCKIHDNASHGLYAEGAAPKIINSFINRNAAEGIRLDDPNSTPTIRNCTITANTGHAIHATGQHPPNVTNSILWYNNAAGNTEQKQGCSVTYSCLYDPNDIPGSTTPDPTTHNITCNPNLAYGHPATSNDFHLAADSPCIDQGHNNAPNPDHDLDNDPRPHNSTTDIGADELWCTDLTHPADLNSDLIINLHDYAILANAWLTAPPDPEFNPDCDLDTNNEIALPDLALLTNDWLWQPCWQSNPTPTWLTTRATPEDTLSTLAAPLTPDSLNTRLLRNQTYQPTLQQQIWQLEDLITWAADLYVADENVRQNIPEEEYKEFLDELYKSLSYVRLQHYLETTGAEASALPEDFEP